ncbi:ATP-binding protein [Nibrella viscosa]|uniref:ATP-binding protein n=1 Tax=Nibrella viscosa TaxID=1084524 RepID=UPI0031ECD7C7
MEVAASPYLFLGLAPVYAESGHLESVRVQSASPAAIDLFGLPEEATDQPLTNLLPAMLSAPVRTQLQQVLDSGDDRQFDLQLLTPTGNRWFDVRASRASATDLHLLFWDITRHRRKAQWLEDILDTTRKGVVVYEGIRDERGVIIDFIAIYCNPALADMTLQKPDDILNRTVTERYADAIGDKLFNKYISVLETGVSVRKLQYLDQQERWYEVSLERMQGYLIATYEEITRAQHTARQEAQNALLLNSVLDASLTAIIAIDSVRDETGTITDFICRIANNTFIRVSGRPATDIIGHRMLEKHPHFLTSEAFSRYVDAVETGQSQQFEQHFPGHHGDRWFTVSVVKKGDGLVLSFMEITDLKHTQHQLEASVNQLSQSNYNLEQFAYVASHDLQEPLRKIQAFSDLLMHHHAEFLNEAGQDLLRRVQDAARRMQLLVRDLLTFSRLTTRSEEFEKVDLNKLVRDVLNDLEMGIVEHKAHINVGPLPEVFGSSLRLQQLIQNLVSNAIKFHKPGEAAVVRITATDVAGHQLPPPLNDQSDKRWVAIEVTDNGIGFEEKYKDRIFQPFQRLHGRHQYAGTGIGLAVCKHVAESHGGAINVRSQPGAGSTFTLFLPV